MLHLISSLSFSSYTHIHTDSFIKVKSLDQIEFSGNGTIVYARGLQFQNNSVNLLGVNVGLIVTPLRQTATATGDSVEDITCAVVFVGRSLNGSVWASNPVR